ncbi:MAG: hypothetical protein EOM12_03885 [Verrucomicrobiae bacterium]|nr:hypothetical protein [Verrucomicrobiae bacterium]
MSVEPEIIQNMFVRHDLAQKKRHIRPDTLFVGVSGDPAQRGVRVPDVLCGTCNGFPAIDHALSRLRIRHIIEKNLIVAA